MTAEARQIDLGDLAAPIAIHDLRAPLVGMVWLTEQLLKTDLDTEQSDGMTALAEAARYALAMADDLADMISSQAGVLTIVSKPTDLRAICLAAARLSGGRAEHKGLAFQVDLGAEPGPVAMVDSRRLSQIVANLLDNAVKYTDRGSVGLSLHCTETNGRLAVVLTVSDTGPGIPEDQQASLLEPYSRGQDGQSQRGLGLGLHVTKLMVDALGGQLRFQSVDGGGTSVIVNLDLPLAPGRSQDVSPNLDDALPAAIGMSRHVLVVDDNAVNRQLMEAILHQLGHVVTLAKSGNDALSVLRTSRFDAILMDYEMPGMNGVETALRIRAMPQHAHRPILALSAHRGGLPADAPSDLYDAAIEKPVSIPALKQALDDAMAATEASGDPASDMAEAV